MCGRLALHHLDAVRALTDLLGISLANVNLDGASGHHPRNLRCYVKRPEALST